MWEKFKTKNGKEILASLRNGRNAALIGMETSGHNTLAEEILVRRKKGECFSILDCRLIETFNRQEIEEQLVFTLTNNKKKNRSWLYEANTRSEKWFILVKNTELAIRRVPELFPYLRALFKIRRGGTAILFSGNHHLLREQTRNLEGASVFWEDMYINLPYNAQISEEILINSLNRNQARQINKKEKGDLVRLAGGNPNLIKGLAKYLNTIRRIPKDLTAENLLTKGEVVIRVNEIYKSLNNEEKEELKVFIEDMNRKNPVTEMFKRVGIINTEGRIFSELFEKYFISQTEKIRRTAEVINGEVRIGGEPQDRKFTAMENIFLRALLTKRNSLLTRDNILEEVWKGNIEKYSEWSLDQLASRLRKKLVFMGLADKLVTLKGRGFMWYEDNEVK